MVLGVQLRSVMMVIGCMQRVAVRHVRMMCSLLMISRLGVLGGLAMVLRGVLVMFRGLFMMLMDIVMTVHWTSPRLS